MFNKEEKKREHGRKNNQEKESVCERGINVCKLVAYFALTVRRGLLGTGVKVLLPVCARKFPENGLSRPANVYSHRAERKELPLSKRNNMPAHKSLRTNTRNKYIFILKIV